MNSNQIEQILKKTLNFQKVNVTGDGSHFQVVVVDERFCGLSAVKRQQIVYAPLMVHIRENSIHALSIKAFTYEEWQDYCKLNEDDCFD